MKIKLYVTPAEFSRILSGEQKEAYRKINLNNLFVFFTLPIEVSRDEKKTICNILKGNDKINIKSRERLFSLGYSFWTQYDEVEFITGILDNSPRATFEIVEILIKKGRADWGAKPGIRYFTIQIGRKINK